MTDLTDKTDQPDQPITIGPLTVEEWASFFYLDDHPMADENPLPPCCGNISDARDAIADALRVGGDPDVCWISIAQAWPLVEGHLAVPIESEDVPLALRKIYKAYVEGRDISRYADAEGKARIMQQRTDLVRDILELIPENFNLDTVEGRMRAVARAGGAFVAYVYDQAERTALIRELATTVGMPYEDVAMMVDVLRLSNGLPWAPAEGARVP